MNVLTLFKEAGLAWSRDHASRLAAALAYYTVFSLAPLLIIIIQIAALVLGGGHASGHHQAVRDAVFSSLQSSLGKDGAGAVQTFIDATVQAHREGIIAAILSWGALLFGAAGLVGALQDALNAIWDAPPSRKGIVQMLRDRLVSFAMLGGIAFVLVVSLVVNTALSAFEGVLTSLLPALASVAKVLDFLLSFAVITALFALIYRYLPDVGVRWRDVWLGAAVTSALFVVGQFLLGWYLARAGAASTYGAAGSLVVIMLWVFYSAQILLFGAEFTKVSANRSASPAGEQARPLGVTGAT